ncbi:MAG: alpha/beta hydrolase [Clostridiales bacterium]|jgi:pimeloyl-ACP methyl ester carboxylesterase|nr:alpha/beta hydrolase [Clostridiales bacterium]
MTAIDQKSKLTLGGFPHKIHILTNDDTRPVVLFIHGGPGVPNRHSIMTAHRDLADAFTLVCYDQRGTGGSYRGAKADDLTPERLVRDAAELAEKLCERFNKDKLFIVGGSWGSELGTQLAYLYPKHIAAYLGYGQMADGVKNEEITYTFALERARESGDAKSVKILENLGAPTYGQYKNGFDGLMAQRKIMTKYGGYSPNEKKRNLIASFVKPIILSGEYSLSDLLGIILGYKFSLKVMWPKIADTDLAKECPKLEMPYFIFDGRFDNNTPASLMDEYFAKIEAPRKELVWFEESGHNPMSDEPERFKTLMREKFQQIAIDAAKEGVKV